MRVHIVSASSATKLQEELNEHLKTIKESAKELDKLLDVEIISCLTQCIPIQTEIIKNISSRHETHKVTDFKWTATMCWDLYKP